MNERDSALLALESQTSPDKRLEAAETLVEIGDVADIPRLIADKQVNVLRAGLALAGLKLPPAEAKELLVRFLSAPEIDLRVEATGRLADLALPDSRGALTGSLEDKELAVRFEAARGIAFLKHAAGFDVLVEALDHANFRFRACGALAMLGDPRAIEPIKNVLNGWFVPPFDRTQAATALAVLGDADGVAHLFNRVAKKRAIDRPMAVESLGELESPEAKAKLLEILDTPGDFARGTAARALGFHGGDDVKSKLSALLKGDGIDDFKLDVAEGLLRAGTRQEVEALTLTDPEAQAELKELLADYETH